MGYLPGLREGRRDGMKVDQVLPEEGGILGLGVGRRCKCVDARTLSGKTGICGQVLEGGLGK